MPNKPRIGIIPMSLTSMTGGWGAERNLDVKDEMDARGITTIDSPETRQVIKDVGTMKKLNALSRARHFKTNFVKDGK